MIIRWPGHAQPGLSRNELVSTVDLMPTLLEAAGLPSDPELPGNSLVPLLQPGRPQGNRFIFGITTGAMPSYFHLHWSIRDDRYKLILNATPEVENPIARSQLGLEESSLPSHFTQAELSLAPVEIQEALRRFLRPPAVQLFDLDKDPDEWQNVAEDPDYAEIRSRLLAALHSFREETRDPFLDPVNLQRFQVSHAAAGATPARDPDFRWLYLDEFPRWRSNAAKE